MKLEKLYSLRKHFTIIGLTGQVGSGCSEIAQKLSDPIFNKSIESSIEQTTSDADELKYKICANFLINNDNWIPFRVINYKDVLLLHLFHEGIVEGENDLSASISSVINIIYQNGQNGRFEGFTNRFDKIEDKPFMSKLKQFLTDDTTWLKKFNYFGCSSLIDCLKGKRSDPKFYSFYFEYFENFSKSFYVLLNEYDLTKRTRLCHDLANNLRDFGTVKNLEDKNIENGVRIENIYTVAETINEIIKIWKRCNGSDHTKIIIDALKNSLELMYFKEKYSAFYMVATKKSEKERKEYVFKQIKLNYSNIYDIDQRKKHCLEILKLDEREYDGGGVNEGEFSEPDTENCIQKSDFHIYFSNSTLKSSECKNYKNLNLDKQLVKLIALIQQPGIITPTSIERSMQIAFNAKFNSGCISRQVGALVTDDNYTVKAIGWNDIPQSQIPCNLRSMSDLKLGKNPDHYSDFERGKISQSERYKDDGKTFKEKIIEEYDKVSKDDLSGKNCPYCFKTFHNAFEGEKNQVHTRSLHAEENAMLQISKYGGQALKGGNLFTTASPCELCSKKAFQLGVKNIYYIDPYPGISRKHIINNGVKNDRRPNLIMFQGAVGRAFHKLYEPIMAYKDELTILTGINPKVSEKQKIKKLTKDKGLRKKIENLIEEHNFKKN